jgi:hypothetical protein
MNMPSAEFETAIPAIEPPLACGLDRTATGIGLKLYYVFKSCDQSSSGLVFVF